MRWLAFLARRLEGVATLVFVATRLAEGPSDGLTDLAAGAHVMQLAGSTGEQ